MKKYSVRFFSVITVLLLVGGVAAQAAPATHQTRPTTWQPDGPFVLRQMVQSTNTGQDRAREAWSAYQNSGDMRWLGIALVALDGIAATPSNRLIKARVLQAMHRFDEAAALLLLDLEKDSHNQEISLLLSAINLAQGQPQKALAACQMGRDHSTQQILLILDFCAGLAESRFGQVDNVFQRLQNRVREVPALSPPEQQWAYGIIAELADQLGRADTLRWYTVALAIGPQDLFLRRAIANYLYRQGRWSDLHRVTAASLDQPQLAVLHLFASRQLQNVDRQSERQLQQQMTEIAQRQDRLDSSSLSWYALLIENKPQKSLDYAQQNWSMQKTPEDARLLLEAALQAQQLELASEVFQWLDESSIDDSRLEKYRQLRQTKQRAQS